MSPMRCVALLLTVVVAACSESAARSRQWVRPGDVVMRDVRMTGALGAKELGEASGVVPSTREPGIFWVLNDSGNDERLFAIDSAGATRGEVRIRGVKNRDWESLASGPCEAGTCLYIGDTGDNRGSRGNLAIHRIVEPTTADNVSSVIATLPLAYADGPHDVEAMYGGPDGSLWLVTKRPARGAAGISRPSRVYRVPPDAWQQAGRYVAQVVDSVPVTPIAGDSRDFITDGAFSGRQSDGARRAVLLSYGAVYVFDTDSITGKPGRLVVRCALPIAERSAEGVSWLPDGRILLLNEGKGAPLYSGRCP